MGKHLFAWCAAVALLGAAPALAQEDEQGAGDEQARVHFESGRQYFDVGDYENALEAFEASYELSGRPQLLYNIAVCHERLARYGAAADALQGYLESGVETQVDRASLEQRLVRLRARAETQGSDDASGDSDGLLIGAIASFGAAGVGLVLAVTFGVLALDEQSALEPCRPGCAPGSDDTMRAFALVTDISAGVAIAGAGLGVALLLLSLDGGGDSSEGDSREVAAAPWATDQGGGLALGGAW